MAVSQSHTTVNCPMPVTTSTSTSIICPDIPDIDAEKSFCIGETNFSYEKFYEKKGEMEIFFMRKFCYKIVTFWLYKAKSNS